MNTSNAGCCMRCGMEMGLTTRGWLCRNCGLSIIHPINIQTIPVIEPVPLTKKINDITDEDIELGENLKRLIEETIKKILEEENE